MSKRTIFGILGVGCALVTGCQNTKETAASGTIVAGSWPETLTVVGKGFPNAGDPCRVIGETAATINYLDDSATLAGCLTTSDAAQLNGRVVGEVDGVILVSVPSKASGDGDGQGDAKVAGSIYNATAQIRCSGYRGEAAAMCDAGVVRNTETGTYVDVTLSDDTKRTIFFDKKGNFLSFSTAEADGTAAMKSTARREGDTIIATLGSERYEIPDVFVLGD
jgi:hypothetical protein